MDTVAGAIGSPTTTTTTTTTTTAAATTTTTTTVVGATTSVPPEPAGIIGGATIEDPATAKVSRGAQFRVTDTLPPPPLPSRPDNWTKGAFINFVELPIEANAFAFTLDDGPSPYNTEPILRELERRRILATFFLIGSNVRAWPEIARRIRDAGHEIGNHSVYHSPYQSAALASQIGPNQAIIHEATGVVPVANRAPGLTRGQAILDACAALGMYEVHTTLNQNDWRSPRWGVDALVAEARREYGRGTFSLNHDGGGRRPTASACSQLIDTALGRGLVPVTATEMIKMGVPTPGGRSYGRISGRQDLLEPEGLGLDSCGYDPELELKARLADPKTKRAERSRIVEVLADFEEKSAQ